MTRIIFLVCCLIGFAVPAFSAISPDGQTILYCPHHIECTSDGRLDSCQLSDNSYEAWQIDYNSGRVVKGKYILKRVQSSYQSTAPRTACEYSIIVSPGIEKLMSIRIQYSSLPNSFEAFISSASQWGVSGDNAECLSDNPQSCPLVETPEIALMNQDSNEVIGTFFHWNEGEWVGSLPYDMLLDLCGPTTACKVNITKPWSETRTGVVTLNIMRPYVVTIVSIDTDQSSNCILKKKEPFNTIYCDPK